MAQEANFLSVFMLKKIAFCMFIIIPNLNYKDLAEAMFSFHTSSQLTLLHFKLWVFVLGRMFAILAFLLLDFSAMKLWPRCRQYIEILRSIESQRRTWADWFSPLDDGGGRSYGDTAIVQNI
jgi:hypothetical protein